MIQAFEHAESTLISCILAVRVLSAAQSSARSIMRLLDKF